MQRPCMICGRGTNPRYLTPVRLAVQNAIRPEHDAHSYDDVCERCLIVIDDLANEGLILKVPNDPA